MQRELPGLSYGSSEEKKGDKSKVTYFKTENVCLKRIELRDVTEDFIKTEQVCSESSCKFQEIGSQYDYSGKEQHVSDSGCQESFLGSSRRRWPFEPEADEEIGTQPYKFP